MTTLQVRPEGAAFATPPPGRPPVAFISWGAVAGRSAELAAALGGSHRSFFPQGAARRPSAPVRYLLSAAGTLWYLWRHRPGLVVVTNPPVPGAWFTSVCARMLGAAVVLDSHPGGFGAQGDRVAARLQWLHRRLARRAAGVLVTDDEWCERVRAWGGRPLVVHEAPGEGATPPPVLAGRFRLLVVGNFNRDEPTAAVFEAARQLSDCDLLLTGDPTRCPPELRTLAPANVQLVGFLDPVSYRAALRDCHAVMTLTTEPTSVMRAAYEAVYAHRPLVVSNWPVARRLFPYAVHADNEAFDLVAAVEKLRGDYEHFCAQVEAAHAQQLARWDRQLRSLADLVEASSAPARPHRRAARVDLDNLDAEHAVRHIVTNAARGRGGRVANVNVDILRQALADPTLLRQINECDLVLADGVPIVWASRLQGTPVAERIPASEMIWPVCEEAARLGVPVFLLGGTPGAAARSAARLAERFAGLQIEHLCPQQGFERNEVEMAAIVRTLTAVRPGIVFCAFGAPKQEKVMAVLARRLPSMWFVACGGTFEMVSGHVPQAPAWMRKSALEWAHRLRHEPRRLFGRYVVRGMPFAAKLLLLTAAARYGRTGRAVLRVRPGRAGRPGRPDRPRVPGMPHVPPIAHVPDVPRAPDAGAGDLLQQVRRSNALSTEWARALSKKGAP